MSCSIYVITIVNYIITTCYMLPSADGVCTFCVVKCLGSRSLGVVLSPRYVTYI